MKRFCFSRWLAVVLMLLLLTLGASSGRALHATPDVSAVNIGHLRAGVDSLRAGAGVFLSGADGVIPTVNVSPGQPVELNVSTEAVFFNTTYGIAVFDLEAFVLGADDSRHLLGRDNSLVTGASPSRQSGTLRITVSFDEPGDHLLVVSAKASGQDGSATPIRDTGEVTLTIHVAASGVSVARRNAQSDAFHALAGLPITAAQADSSTAVTQLDPLAFPRVHVFSDGQAGAKDFVATSDPLELTVQQGRRTRVEVQPEVVWYDGAPTSSATVALELTLIDTEGAHIPFGRSERTLTHAGPALGQSPVFVNMQFPSTGEYEVVAQVSVAGPGAATAQGEVSLHVTVEPPPSGQTGFIGGRVVAEDTGLPLAEVPVIARAADGSGPARRTLTHTDGRYLIEVLWPGQYLVQVPHQLPRKHSDYVGEFYEDAEDSTSATPVTVRAGRTTKGIDFALSPIGSISGVIVAEDTRAPVRSALVSAGLPGNSYTIALGRANEDGTYVVGPLSPGLYWVRVSPGNDPPGLVGEYYEDASTLEEATLVPVEAKHQTQGIDFLLASREVVPGHGSIAGRVTAELQPGETEPSPLEGMSVLAENLQDFRKWGEAYTEPDGSYRIDDLPAGHYRVEARDRQRLGVIEFYNHVLDWREATPVRVTEGETTSGINFSLPPRPTSPGAIAGRVMVANQEGVVRKPLETLDVWAEPVNPSGRPWRRYGLTDSSGNYRMELLEPGAYLLHVVDPPALFATQYFDHAATPEEATPVIVTGGQTASGIDFDLLIDTSAPHLGSISGRITAEPPPGETQQVPLEGIVVEGFEQYGHELTFWAVTGADGAYRLDHLLVDSYLVRARDPNGVYMTEYYSEWYDNAITPYQASYVYVARGSAVTGIDIALAPLE